MTALVLSLMMQNPWADFQSKLEEIRVAEGAPAVGAALVPLDGDPYIWVTGVRKQGESDKVTKDDLWHLGSCTKAMTAAVISTMVKEGSLRWDEPVLELFPEIADAKIDKAVTLRHLLCMRGGIDPNAPNWWAYDASKKSLFDQREDAVRDALTLPMKQAKIGEYTYSNWSLVTAGHAAERIAKEPIEKLLTDRLFKPLGMNSAGFGPLGPDQPWPHNDKGALPGTGFNDNAAVMTAAGRAHMSLHDWGLFVREVLRGLSGRTTVIPKTYFDEIVTHSLGDNYAMGWGLQERPWAKGHAYSHSGSNTVNYCTVWIAPGRGYAWLVTTNTGYAKANEFCDKVVGAMIERTR